MFHNHSTQLTMTILKFCHIEVLVYMFYYFLFFILKTLLSVCYIDVPHENIFTRTVGVNFDIFFYIFSSPRVVDFVGRHAVHVAFE